MPGAASQANVSALRGSGAGLGGRPAASKDANQRTEAAGAGISAGQHGWQQRAAIGSVFGRWAEIVGPDLAAHTKPDSFTDGELAVTADSTAWATQARVLAPQLVRRLAAELGDGTVRRVKVRGPEGRRGHRRGQDLARHLISQHPPRAARARRVLQPGQPGLGVLAAPLDHCRLGAARPLGDLRAGQPVGGQQHDPGPLHHPGRDSLRPGPSLQLRPVSIGHRQNTNTIGHVPLSRWFPRKLKERHSSDH
jgi:hypothetical protein